MTTKKPDCNNSNWRRFIGGVKKTSVLFLLWIIGCFVFAEYKAKEWGQNLKYYSELSPKSNSALDGDSNIAKESQPEFDFDTYIQGFEYSEAEKQRIQQQVETVRSRAKTHLRVAKDFYIWSSMVSAISLFSSVIIASCLLHITRKGWDDSNSAIQGIFTVSFATLAFSSSCIFLYEYEKNRNNNAALYVFYVNLEGDILTALATKSPLSQATNSSSLSEVKDKSNLEKNAAVSLKPIILLVQENLNKSHTLDLEIDLNRSFNARDFLEQSGLE